MADTVLLEEAKRRRDAALARVAYPGGRGHDGHMAELERRMADLVRNVSDLDRRVGMLEAETRARLAPYLAESRIVGDVRIFGNMCILELVRDRETREPVRSGAVPGTVLNRMISVDSPTSLQAQGYLFRAAGPFKNCVKWMPSLAISKSLLMQSLDRLIDALKEREDEFLTEA